MNDRILAREATGHRKATPTRQTLAGLRELDGCSSMAEFALLDGRYPGPARLLYFAGERPRSRLVGRDAP